MKIANIHEAKSSLSKLIEAVMAGEDVVISKAGKPLVRLVPYQKNTGNRIPGSWKGQVKMSEDFNEALPLEILAGFTGQ